MISLSEMLKKRNEIMSDEIDEEEYVNVESESSSSFDITQISPPCDFNTTSNHVPIIEEEPSTTSTQFNFNTTSNHVPIIEEEPSTTSTQFNFNTTSNPVFISEEPSTTSTQFNFNTTTDNSTSPHYQFNSATLDTENFPEFRNRNNYIYENPVFDKNYPVRRIYTGRKNGISTKKFYLCTIGGMTLFLSLIVLNDYLLLSGKFK
jgi:hypothetical protein